MAAKIATNRRPSGCIGLMNVSCIFMGGGVLGRKTLPIA
jgi:hypothetical protein